MSAQLTLPAPDALADTASTSSIAAGGLALDALGPIIINADGTTSRIANWTELSPGEQAVALKRVARRNAERRAALESEPILAPTSTQALEMQPEASVSGGCLCRRTRYEVVISDVSSPVYCHCSLCRRAHASTRGVAWFTVPTRAFKWTGGEPREYRSSPSASRFFCPACGTQLVFRSDAARGEVDIATATVDGGDALGGLPASLLPAGVSHGDSAPRWEVDVGALPARG
jgi:hypothetical protein